MIKRRRKDFARDNAADNSTGRLLVKERVQKEKLKFLKRGYENG